MKGSTKPLGGGGNGAICLPLNLDSTATLPLSGSATKTTVFPPATPAIGPGFASVSAR